jgi:hypothetical protein
MRASRHCWSTLPALLTSAALMIVPLRDPLAWWHLFWGRTIAGFGAVPAANHVRYTLAELAPALHPSWLADLAMWSAYAQGGLPLLLTLRALLLAGALGLGCYVASRRVGGPIAALLATIGLVIALPAVEPGPALLAAPLLAILLCAASGRAALWAAVLPLTTLLWANIEPACWVLPALGASVALAQTERRAQLAWWAGWIASLLALCATPRGAALLPRALDIARSWPSSPLLGPSWAALPVTASGLAMLLVLGALALGAPLVRRLRAGERGAIAPLVWLIALVLQALWTQRGLIWLGVALPFIAAQAVEARAATKPRLPWWGSAGLGGLALVAMTLCQPLWAYHPDLARSLSPYTLRPAQPHAALILDETPIEGVALLNPYPTKPRLWITPRWAGLALLELEPAPPDPLIPLVQLDPRPELGDPALLELHALVMTSDVWRGVFQQHQVRAALLDARGQGRYLVEALRSHPDWYTAHQTEDYVLFLRR